MNRERLIKYLNRITLIFFICIICVAAYIMVNDIGLIEGLDLGPGPYYYSDIPGWAKILYTNDFIKPNTQVPVFFLAFFIGWGLVVWNAS